MNSSVATERRLPGLVELDSKGTVLFFAWIDELSQSQTDLVGRNFFSEVAPFENVAELRGYFETFHRGRSPTNHFHFNCEFVDGRERVRVMLARLREKHNPTHPGAVLMYIRKAPLGT
jgi:hypothetical protein